MGACRSWTNADEVSCRPRRVFAWSPPTPSRSAAAFRTTWRTHQPRADMRDRAGRVGQLEPPQRRRPVLAVAGLPVERPRPALGEGFRPALPTATAEACVAAVLNELHALLVGHQTVGEPERLGQHAVTWSLMVEREATPSWPVSPIPPLEVGEGDGKVGTERGTHLGRCYGKHRTVDECHRRRDNAGNENDSPP